MSRSVWWIVTLINLVAGAHGIHDVRAQCEPWRAILAGFNMTAALGSALMAITAPARRPPLKGTGY